MTYTLFDNFIKLSLILNTHKTPKVPLKICFDRWPGKNVNDVKTVTRKPIHNVCICCGLFCG